MYKFIIDTQLSPLISEFLRFKGFDATHTSEYPNGIFTSDKEISEIAVFENRIIVSKDSDFLDIFLLSKVEIKVIMLETGNMKNKELLKILTDNLHKIIELLEQNHKLIILQKHNIISY